jgi:hypothetical protein
MLYKAQITLLFVFALFLIVLVARTASAEQLLIKDGNDELVWVDGSGNYFDCSGNPIDISDGMILGTQLKCDTQRLPPPPPPVGQGAPPAIPLAQPAMPGMPLPEVGPDR